MNPLGVAVTFLLSACATPGPQCVALGNEALGPSCVIAPKCRFNCDVVVTITEAEGLDAPPPVTVNAEATQSLTRQKKEETP